MNNELLPVSNGTTPTTRVEQNGEKNVYVEHANEVNQSLYLIQSNITATPRTTLPSGYKQVNPEFYNLFVYGDELIPNDPFVLPPDRALPIYWTEDNIRAEYAQLSNETIQKVKTFPSLFMAEARGYRARADADEKVFFGFVDDVRIQGNGIRIRWNAVWEFPMCKIAEIGFDLGMLNMDRAITEMNRSHWSIKHINLYEELKLAGLSIMGM